MSTNENSNSNTAGGFLASLNQFANSQINSQVFIEQLTTALDNMHCSRASCAPQCYYIL